MPLADSYSIGILLSSQRHWRMARDNASVIKPEEYRTMTSCSDSGWMKRLVASASVLALVTLWSGCGGNEVDRLKRAAEKIANAEMAKFNAQELKYKDEVYFSSIGAVLPEIDYGNGQYIRRYRIFNGYQLKDIVKTDSMVAPYILVIEYSYDFMMTPPKSAKSVQDQEARDACAKETQFIPELYHLIRRYHCDAKGNFVGKISDLPPLENFYSHGGIPPETSVLAGVQ